MGGNLAPMPVQGKLRPKLAGRIVSDAVVFCSTRERERDEMREMREMSREIETMEEYGER